MHILGSCAAAVAAFSFLGGLASASNFSFGGAFSKDDQLQGFLFTLASTNTVVLQTFSYAGGTNQTGGVIPEGGFDPWLSLYDSSGNLLRSVDNGSCAQVGTDSMSGKCLDSFISQSLTAGTYTLVLSQSNNGPAGNSLSNGFVRTGQPTFTSTFGCSNGQFCDSSGFNRTGNWAVDIDGVLSASTTVVSTVPEPGTFVLLSSGAGLMLLRRRRFNR